MYYFICFFYYYYYHFLISVYQFHCCGTIFRTKERKQDVVVQNNDHILTSVLYLKVLYFRWVANIGGYNLCRASKSANVVLLNV